MIKRFRPFWSYDVLKTEAWLNKMCLDGYHLKQINYKSRTFVFEKGESINLRHRICYDKYFNGQIPNQLIEAGWRLLLSDIRFYVLTSSCENPSVMPSYLGVLERNRKIKFVSGLIILIIILYQLPLVSLLVIALISSPSDNVTVVSDDAFQGGLQIIGAVIYILMYTIILMQVAWLIYTFIKLRASNKRIEKLYPSMPNLSFTTPTDGLMNKDDEKALAKSNKMIRRIRLAWIYSPDKIENWLEDMESEGYNLYRMSKLGNSFFFIKDTPRKIKYVVDYQNKTGASYFTINTECGWKLIFTSLSRFQAMTVWSHEYGVNGEPPQYYSDEQSKLKNAKKFALAYSLCFFPICAVYIALIIFEISAGVGHTVSWTTFALQTLIIVEFSAFALRTVLYYFRVKKKLRDK